MIDLTFINWCFKENGHLYSTEVLETSRVRELTEDLEKVIDIYGLTKVAPISGIFWETGGTISLQDIRDLLKEALEKNKVQGPAELEAYQKLLGPELRHGREIFKEVSDLTKSILDGHGKYDPVYILDDLLTRHVSGISMAEIDAIKEARTALVSVKKPERLQERGERQYTVRGLLEELGIDTKAIPQQENLDLGIQILQDDGMGYGAVNGPCNCIDFRVDNNIGLWF